MKFYTYLRNLLLATTLVSCSNSDSEHHLKVAATSIPHAEILEKAKSLLHEKGIDLEIIVVEDFNTPNRALQDGEIDANFFQHLPFLEAQLKDFGYKLESLVAVHVEPMGLYSRKLKSLAELKTNAKIAIPNDPTNQARALFLLQNQGLIKLNKNDISATVHDIVENPLKLEFLEIDSALLSRTLDDADLAAINANFALQAGLNPQKDALALEDKNSKFVNIVVVREGESKREDLQNLKSVLESSTIKNFIIENYKGSIEPVN